MNHVINKVGINPIRYIVTHGALVQGNEDSTQTSIIADVRSK